MPKSTDSQRLFFALWPATGLATQIDHTVSSLLGACQGRKIHPQNLHITLAFLGSLDAAGRQCVEAAAARVHVAPFEFTLEKLGYWPRPRIVWLAPADVPAPMTAVQAVLVQALAQDCAYQPETRPFRPHLSLMRKARRRPAEASIPPLVWRVDGFVLVRSHTHSEGVEYEVLKHWSLRD